MRFKRGFALIICMIVFSAMALGSGSSGGSTSSETGTTVGRAEQTETGADEKTESTEASEPEKEEVNDPGIETAASLNEMGLGDIGVKDGIYVGLSYVKRMTYLPTALGTEEKIGAGNEVILAFFDFYNNENKSVSIAPEDITCYADGTQAEDVETYIKVECDGIKQFYREDVAEHSQMISVQDYEVPTGWEELKFFYKSECIWIISQDDVKTEPFNFESMYSDLVISRDITNEGDVIYSGDYEIIFQGVTDYVYNNVVYGDQPYTVFKFTINNTGSSAIDYSTAGHKMSAYQNNYYLGDAMITLDDKIDGYSNIFNIDSIEVGMSANVYVAFDSFGDGGNLYMIYDDGYISSDYRGFVYVER